MCIRARVLGFLHLPAVGAAGSMVGADVPFEGLMLLSDSKNLHFFATFDEHPGGCLAISEGPDDFAAISCGLSASAVVVVCHSGPSVVVGDSTIYKGKKEKRTWIKRQIDSQYSTRSQLRCRCLHKSRHVKACTVIQTCNLVHIPQRTNRLVTYERCVCLSTNDTRLFLLLHFWKYKYIHIWQSKGER